MTNRTARDAIARWSTTGTECDPTAYDYKIADSVLSALEAEGFTVAKLEQVGWRRDEPGATRVYENVDPAIVHLFRPVFRVAGPTEGETNG